MWWLRLGLLPRGFDIPIMCPQLPSRLGLCLWLCINTTMFEGMEGSHPPHLILCFIELEVAAHLPSTPSLTIVSTHLNQNVDTNSFLFETYPCDRSLRPRRPTFDTSPTTLRQWSSQLSIASSAQQQLSAESTSLTVVLDSLSRSDIRE